MAELVRVNTRFSAFISLQGKENPAERLNPNQLSKATGIPREIIQRWGDGKAVPAWDPQNKYITKLADALGASVEELAELQREALEERKKVLAERKAEFKKGKNPDLNEALTEIAKALGAESKEDIDKKNSNSNPLDTSAVEELEEKDDGPQVEVIDDRKHLAQIMIEMMSRLGKAGAAGNHVFCTFQGAEGVFATDDEKKAWANAKQAALDKGVTIEYLVCLDKNAERTREIVSNIMQSWGSKGQFKAFAFYQEGTLEVPEGFFIISEAKKDGSVEPINALFAIKKDGTSRESTTTSSSEKLPEDRACVDAAVYMSRNKNLDLRMMKYFHHHWNLRKEREATEIFTSETTTNIIPVLAEIDGNIMESSTKSRGNALIFSRRLTDFINPMNYYTSRDCERKVKSHFKNLHGRLPGKEELIEEIELRQRRFYSELRSQVEKKLRCEIYPKSIIEDCVQNGENRRILRLQLNELCRLVKIYPNYQVAFLDKSLQKLDSDVSNFLKKVKPMYFEVRTGSRVVVEFDCMSEKSDESQSFEVKKPEWLLTQNPLVVDALENMMQGFWDAIEEEDKDKFLMLDWLEKQIKFLNKA
jgi:hypothetical protein